MSKIVKDFIYITIKLFSFPSRTPASPLSPGRLIICIRIWSSWLGDKVGSCLWNSLLLQSSLETVQATSFRVVFWTRGWISPLGFFRRSFLRGSKIGLLIDIFKIFGYQTCAVQVGVINMSLGTCSLSVLLRTFGMMQNWGKVCRCLCYQFCWNASVAWLWGSGLHAT